MICPRCHRASADGSVFCPGCGAPLTLRPEPTAPNLDATIDLDRRGPAAPQPAPIPPAHRAPPANVASPTSAPRPRPAVPPVPSPARAAPPAAPRTAAPAPRPPGAAPAPLRAGAPAVAPRPPAARPPAPPPPPRIPADVPADAPPGPAFEPVAPAVEDRSYWDLRASELPRERKADLDPDPFLAATASMPRAPEELVPEPKPDPRAAPPGPILTDEPFFARVEPSSSSALKPPDEPAPSAAPARRSASARAHDTSVDVDVGPMEVQLRRAPSWKRITAWVLDGLPFVLAFGAVLRVALDSLPNAPAGLLDYVELAGAEAAGITGPIFAGAVVLFGVYHALAHGLTGATLGKRLVGIRVVRRDGHRPGLARATVRAVLAGLSLALVGLGVLLALFTPSGRGLHDLLARTWVVEAP